MKVKITFLLSSILLCFFSQAQEIHFGVTADVNLTKMDGKGLSSKTQAGYNGGVYAVVKLNNKWSVQPELLYTLRNVEKSDEFMVYYINEGRSFAETDMSLHYLSIPVLINYQATKSIRISAGPEYSRLLSSNDDLLKDNQEAFKKNELGARAGLQYVFSPSFSVFGTYYYGITNSNNIDNRYQWHNSQLRFGISIGVF